MCGHHSGINLPIRPLANTKGFLNKTILAGKGRSCTEVYQCNKTIQVREILVHYVCSQWNHLNLHDQGEPIINIHCSQSILCQLKLT